MVGLGIRLYGLNAPPTDFHPVRQYRSAHLARAYYFRLSPSVPEWRRVAAEDNLRREGPLEPPVPEAVAALAYRVLGGERMWFPRALSALLWVVGGVFLFLLAARLSSPEGGLVALATYLFLPYGIGASRSFQPDPWMVMAFLAGLWALWRSAERPSLWRLVEAGAICLAAILMKPTSAFLVVAAVLPLELLAHRPAPSRLGRVGLFLLVAVFPSAVYYSYHLWGAHSLHPQMQRTFLPHVWDLWKDHAFWSGWRLMLVRTVGYGSLLAGLLGVALCRPRPGKVLLLGLWLGYGAMGLAFSYHIHTHDYYSLPLLPIMALSAAPLAAFVIDGLFRPLGRPVTYGLLSVALAGAGALSVNCARPSFPPAGPSRQEVVGRAVGNAIGHRGRALLFSESNGSPLRYYGEFDGAGLAGCCALACRTVAGTGADPC